jgi:hypothetical protein
MRIAMSQKEVSSPQRYHQIQTQHMRASEHSARTEGRLFCVARLSVWRVRGWIRVMNVVWRKKRSQKGGTIHPDVTCFIHCSLHFIHLLYGDWKS